MLLCCYYVAITSILCRYYVAILMQWKHFKLLDMLLCCYYVAIKSILCRYYVAILMQCKHFKLLDMLLCCYYGDITVAAGSKLVVDTNPDGRKVHGDRETPSQLNDDVLEKFFRISGISCS